MKIAILKLLFIVFSLFTLLFWSGFNQPVSAAVSRTWAVDDGEKIRKTDNSYPLATDPKNAVWNGNTISIFGAKNEIVAFQVIIEADSSGANGISVTLPSLTNGSSVIKNTSTDPYNYVGRNIELFTEYYANITSRTNRSFIWWNDARPMDIRGQEYTGWLPDALIPAEAPSGKGGFPFTIAANNNQAVWVDITIPKTVPEGIYSGSISVLQNGSSIKSIPVNLTVYNFTLPDESHFKNFFLTSSTELAAKHGVTDGSAAYNTIENRYFQMFHRHRMDMNTQDSLTEMKNHFIYIIRGDYYTTANGYDGPGVGTPHGTYSIGTYDQPNGTKSGFTGTKEAYWLAEDAWYDLFKQYSPATEIFKYLRDEPVGQYSADAIQEVKDRSGWLKTNPSGKIIMSYDTVGGLGDPSKAFGTSTADMNQFDNYLDFWAVTSQSNWVYNGYSWGWTARASDLKAHGKKLAFYNGTIPSWGSHVIDTDAIDFRVMPWIGWKYKVDQYFNWYSDKYTSGRNEYSEPYAVDSSGTYKSWGNGLMVYPGQDKEFTAQDLGLPGPVASIRMKNWRRGQQDYEYLWLAKQKGLTTQVNSAVNTIVPKALADLTWCSGDCEQHQPAVWGKRGYNYENQRLILAKALGGTQATSPTNSPTISPTPTVNLKPGDANGDQKIDGVDYTLWLAHYKLGVIQSGGNAIADFNNDNFVDGVDYTIWLNNYGK